MEKTPAFLPESIVTETWNGGKSSPESKGLTLYEKIPILLLRIQCSLL
jgi:hypothetical protein